MECVFNPGDVVEVRRIPSKRSTWHDARTLPEMAAILSRDNKTGQNIYVGVNPRTKEGGKTANDVALARCLVADFDHIEPNAARAQWEGADLPEPTLLIASGHGVHAYWRLRAPLSNLAEWSTLQRALSAALDSDRAIHDPPRLMRLPGFDNCKGEPRVSCQTLLALPQNRYTVAEMSAAVSHVTESTESTETTEENRRSLKTTEAIASRLAFASELRLENPEALDSVILDALPKSIGKRHRQVFELARALKGIAAFADAPPDYFRPFVKRWHTRGVEKAVIGTEPFEETWIDFLKAWPRVKFPKGNHIMDRILCEARANPTPLAADRYEPVKLRLLVCLCRVLQNRTGNQAFFLSCRTAGRLLEVSHMQANRWLFLLEHDGILSVVERGTQSPQRATRYRYSGDRIAGNGEQLR